MKVIVLPALLTGASTDQKKIAVCKGMDRKIGNERLLLSTATFVFVLMFTTLWDGVNGY